MLQIMLCSAAKMSIPRAYSTTLTVLTIYIVKTMSVIGLKNRVNIRVEDCVILSYSSTSAKEKLRVKTIFNSLLRVNISKLL